MGAVPARPGPGARAFGRSSGSGERPKGRAAVGALPVEAASPAATTAVPWAWRHAPTAGPAAAVTGGRSSGGRRAPSTQPSWRSGPSRSRDPANRGARPRQAPADAAVRDERGRTAGGDRDGKLGTARRSGSGDAPPGRADARGRVTAAAPGAGARGRDRSSGPPRRGGSTGRGGRDRPRRESGRAVGAPGRRWRRSARCGPTSLAGPRRWGGLARRGAGRALEGGASDAWRAARRRRSARGRTRARRARLGARGVDRRGRAARRGRRSRRSSGRRREPPAVGRALGGRPTSSRPERAGLPGPGTAGAGPPGVTGNAPARRRAAQAGRRQPRRPLRVAPQGRLRRLPPRAVRGRPAHPAAAGRAGARGLVGARAVRADALPARPLGAGQARARGVPHPDRAAPSSTRCWPTAPGRSATTPRSRSCGRSCGRPAPAARSWPRAASWPRARWPTRAGSTRRSPCSRAGPGPRRS